MLIDLEQARLDKLIAESYSVNFSGMDSASMRTFLSFRMLSP